MNLLRANLENHPRLKLVSLPPYAPTLNLIEPLWNVFKKSTLYYRYHETSDTFRKVCEDSFLNPQRYPTEIRSLLTENFTIAGG